LNCPPFAPLIADSGLQRLATMDQIHSTTQGRQRMNNDFDLIRNHHERAVFAAVRAAGPRHPNLDESLFADIACVALNRLTPRYIRHEVDFSFYLTDSERAENVRNIEQAVASAFEFVQARVAERNRH
jgi:hypothetical protein